jgi:hypothetical protein
LDNEKKKKWRTTQTKQAFEVPKYKNSLEKLQRVDLTRNHLQPIILLNQQTNDLMNVHGNQFPQKMHNEMSDTERNNHSPQKLDEPNFPRTGVHT